MDSHGQFFTESGTISYQPADSVKEYCFEIQAGENAQVTVNGKKYDSGDYTINANAAKRIGFDSPNGALIVQDLSMGKLSIANSMAQTNQAVSPQPAPADSSNLTLVEKEYTESDLQQLGITGIRIEATAKKPLLQGYIMLYL